MKHSLNIRSATKRRRLASLAPCLVLGLLTAQAGTYSWDADANGGNGAGGGTGTWNTSLTNWHNGTTDVAWPNVTANDDKATFAGTAGTVTVGASINAGGILFNTSGYSLNSSSYDLTLAPQATGSDAIAVASGVTGTSISLRRLILTTVGASNPGDFINTDQINFNNTLVCFSGSRQMVIENSSTSATTTFGRFAVGSSTSPGAASFQLKQGNLVINSMAGGSTASGLAAANSTATNAEIRFALATGATGTQTITINGNNTLFNNAGTGTLSFKLDNANATLVLGHNNALGARDGSNNLTDTIFNLNAGTVASNGNARVLENATSLNGSATVGGSDAFTFSGSFTNSGGNRTLTVNNTALTTLSGPVNLANDNATARTLTIGGTGNTEISGAVANNNAGNTLASGLTKSGAGTLTLTGTSTYTGSTTVAAGLLVVNGSLGSTAVSVEASGTIGGSGSLGGTLSFADGARLSVNLADPLSVAGQVSFANFGFDDLLGFNVETADIGTYTLLTGSNIVTANIQNFGPTQAYTRLDGNKAYFDTGSLTVQVVVPEPAAVALIGLVGLGALFRRRR